MIFLIKVAVVAADKSQWELEKNGNKAQTDEPQEALAFEVKERGGVF